MADRSVTCIVANSDSRLAWGRAVASALKADELTQQTVELVPTSLAARARDDRKNIEIWSDFGTLPIPTLMRYDILIIGLGGEHTNHLLTALASHCPPAGQRPVTITGFPGLVFRDLLESVMWRQGSDVVCLNTQEDLALAQAGFEELGLPTEPLTRTGVPTGETVRPSTQPVAVFAAQNNIPIKLADRAILLRLLEDWQNQQPDFRVAIKPRNLPGKQKISLHRERYPYEEIDAIMYAGSPHPTPLEFTYQPMPELLGSCAALFTVSSTAALEAARAGVPTCIISDLGVTETMGNAYFRDSGLISRIADFDPRHCGVARRAWLSEHEFDTRSLCHAVAAVDREARPQAPYLRTAEGSLLAFRRQITQTLTERHGALGIIRWALAQDDRSLVCGADLRQSAAYKLGQKITAPLRRVFGKSA